ncbi:MAG: hypothetical protein IJF94_03035 [Eubacterium sp.]|nr:hypothetical protein [Eubacterium sp.]
MDTFITEHGGVIGSSIVAFATIIILFTLIVALSQMDLLALATIMG